MGGVAAVPPDAATPAVQICNHPMLTYPPDPYSTLKQFVPADERIISECGKMLFLDPLLIKLFKTGHRVLLFSTMTKVLDLLEAYLRWRTVDGTHPAPQTRPTHLNCLSRFGLKTYTPYLSAA